MTSPQAPRKKRDKTNAPYAFSHSWRKKVATWRKKLERDPALAVCWLCGGAIDMNLPPTHGRAFTLDHLVPLSQGGELMGEVKPAHRSCNSARGNGRSSRRGPNPPTLLDW